MGFAQALDAEKLKATRKGPTCSVTATLAVMSDADAKAFQAALDDPAIAHKTLSRALRSEGHNVADGTIRRHRNGECQCGLR